MAHPDQDLYPGQILNGRWEVGSFLGDGNFSLVYEGRELPGGTPCAIKVLSLTRNHADARLEFDTEGELLASLTGCSNVISLLDRGEHQMPLQGPGGISVPVNVPYIVLERADANLAELLLRRHQVTWADRLELFRGAVKGMHQMHLYNYVNRDLKSDNVLLVSNGRTTTAMVADLGRSRDTRALARFSNLAYEFGRGDLRFAAPEFLWGLGSLDAQSMRRGDLYLIGSLLFEMATAQGITAMALGSPQAIINSISGMTPQDRQRDFTAHMSDLQARYALTYDVFRQELPAPIRDVGMKLLRRLTAADPAKREPSPERRGGITSLWDLQWVLRQVDILRLTLSTEIRRAEALSRKKGTP